VSNPIGMRPPAAKGSRRATLRLLAERVLEAPDLSSLTRLLTQELPRALGARDATLLRWDRRLETFESVSLGPDGRLRSTSPEPAGQHEPRTRWLLSEGQLLEAPSPEGEGMLVPLLARSGMSGMLVLGHARRRRRPVSTAEARLVSVIAGRAALALENHAFQRELIASERLAALGTMAEMLVHDLRGPMTIIRGYAETLLTDGLSRAEVSSRAALIVDAVDRLERMTTETLDFARGAERLVRRSVPLTVLLLDLAAGLEADLPGLEVVRDFDLPAGRRGSVDVDKLRRAVFNIAANAREAMGGRGRLLLSASVARIDSAEQLVLELADEGPGVAHEIADRVFDPFVTSGKKRGTGLGLAVARRFVEDHGGRVELVHDPPSARGARFRIALPLPGGAGERAR
jgi:signal transduction histidine kinase